MDRGTVVAFNPRTQKMAVAVDGDQCALFELVDEYDIRTGHKLQGELESGHCFTIKNLTTGEVLSVIPQGEHLSFTAAQQAVHR